MEKNKVLEWFVDSCNEMLEDDKYSFAYDTISGIRHNVIYNKRITDKQKNAIRNIRASVK